MPWLGAARQRIQNPNGCLAMSDSRTFSRLLPALLLLALPYLALAGAEPQFTCNISLSASSIVYDSAAPERRNYLAPLLECFETSATGTSRFLEVIVTADAGLHRGRPLAAGEDRFRIMRRSTGTGNNMRYNLYNRDIIETDILTDGSGVGMTLNGQNSQMMDGYLGFNFRRDQMRAFLQLGTGGNTPAFVVVPGQDLLPGTYTDTVVFTIADRMGRTLGTTSHTLTAVIDTSCTFEFGQGSLGSINFGNYDSDAPGVFPLPEHGRLMINCTEGTEYTVFGNRGLHALAIEDSDPIFIYRMKLDGGESYLNYGLWTSADMEIYWTNQSFCNRCPESWPIHGQIKPGQIVPPGTYRDTVTFTLTVE